MGAVVSIIIRSYNSQKTIIRAIKSAVSQNFPSELFNIDIVDDCSTDDTLKVIKEFLNEKNVKVIRLKKNVGHVDAANIGFKKSQSKYVVLLDDDDSFEPNLLMEEVEFLESHDDINLLYSHYFEKNGQKVRIVKPKNIFESVAGGTMYRRSVLASAGYFDKVLFPEYELLLKNPERWKTACVNKPLFTYSRTSTSLTRNKALVKEALNLLKEKYPSRLSLIRKIRTYDSRVL